MNIKSGSNNLVAVVVAGLSLLAAPRMAQSQGHDWVMTMSWSPEYCEQHKGSNEPQCNDEYYFVNFGLMSPGYVGDATLGSACSNRDLPPDEAGRWGWTIPNEERIRYVWAKQGACTSLDQKEFYTQLDYASRRVTIPEKYKDVKQRLAISATELRADFVSTNPEMSAESIVLKCDAHWLVEAQVCFDNNMQFKACEFVGDCPAQIWLRPLRLDRIKLPSAEPQ